MYDKDTIASVATAPGVGAIGIIRISGEKTFNIVEKIFKGSKKFKDIKSHTIHYGSVVDPITNKTIDEVLISKMKRPKTFTREDIVEINCHGGPVVLKNILKLVCREGARVATPGEFTKRAFLNGRIDLTQAEAIIDIINSRTEESLATALEQLEGKLSKKIKEIREELIQLISHIEVYLDYPEYDIEEVTGSEIEKSCISAKTKLVKIIDSFERGKIIRQGLKIAIVGQPNVGKSSLLNELTGKNRAIVTDIPGTTRDVIEEYINIGGIPITILDTAGLRQTNDTVEKIGIEIAKETIDKADLVVFIIDPSQKLEGDTLDLLHRLKSKKTLILINKIDIVQEDKIKNIEDLLDGMDMIKTAIKFSEGIEKIEEYIKEEFLKGEISMNQEVLVTNVRHKNSMDEALQSIENALIAYKNSMPHDLITIDIKIAAEKLGDITGESLKEDVLKEIFKNFCVGK